MKWPLTFYVDSLSKGVQGRANGPIIRILKSSKDDEGLYQHELTHVKQWLSTLGLLHGVLYRFYDKYRFWAEVQAYKKQAACYQDDRTTLFAGYISCNYKLNVGKEYAERKLRE
jgi:hypothetical protein